MDKRTNVITKNPINFIGTRFLKLYLLIGFILRIILMWNVPEDSSFSFWEIIRFLSVGFVTDICMAILLALPLQIINLGLNEAKYHRVTGWIIELLLTIAFAYVLFFHTIEYFSDGNYSVSPYAFSFQEQEKHGVRSPSI